MILTGLAAPAPDAILKLMRAFAEDPRPEKVDLGVGVYRREDGHTPVMVAIKEAERRLWGTQKSKSYVGLSGDPEFLDAIRALTLGPAVDAGRVAGAATPGGTGAVRQALDLVRITSPESVVWVSDPTWPNHLAILNAVGLRWKRYRYLDAENGSLDSNGLTQDLAEAKAGDVLLLHGCCHNPTGVDLTESDWRDMSRFCADKGLLPMVDLAYQGFGAGLEADVAGLRLLAASVPELLLCVSGSKNFGLYRDRAGAVLVVASDAMVRERAASCLAGLNRQSYSFPPDHGARLVTMVLGDPELKEMWESELTEMRLRIAQMRHALSEALRRDTGSDRFGFLAAQHGLFSLLPATPEDMRHLRAAHAVYAVEDGRINLAGLTPATVDPVAQAIAATLT